MTTPTPTRTKPTLRQRLFNLLSAVSLVLLVVSGLIWLRSAAAIDTFSYATPVDLDQRYWFRRYVYDLASVGGIVCIEFRDVRSRFGISDSAHQGVVTESRIGNTSIRDAQPFLLLNLRGRSLDDRQRGDAYMSRRHVSVNIPYWLLTLPMSIAPAIWLLRLRRARAQRPGGFAIMRPAPSAGSTG